MPKTLVLSSVEGQPTLRRTIRRALRIFIIGRNDSESLTLARAVQNESGGTRFPTKVLFHSADVAALWNDQDADRRGGINRSRVVAAHVLRRQPARREGAVSAPPIIVGAGPIANELLQGTVRGWQEPGEVVHVHCIGVDREWYDDALAELQTRVAGTWSAVPTSRVAVAGEVDRLIGEWKPPRPDRYTIEGPSVVVSFTKDTVTVPIADAIALRQPTARVTAVVTSAGDWEHWESRPNLTFAGANDLVVTLEDLLRTRIDALCDEIVADLGRWPEDRISVIAVQRPNAGEVALFRDQERGTQTKVRAIADSIADILQAGNVELDHEQRVDAPPIFHSPTELTRMARLVKGLLGEAPGVDFEVALGDPAQESRLRLLEFVARLPTLAARAGFLPHRPADASNDLSEGQIQTLAMGAHENYTATAQKTGNATLSGNWTRRWSELDTVEQHSNLAQIFDAPVKLAMVHLTWRRAEDPQLHEFTNDEIELLAELEHRRWHHFQLRNGRPGHLWAVPWAGMEESVKDYDRDAVRGLPALLADAGLEIVSEPGSS